MSVNEFVKYCPTAYEISTASKRLGRNSSYPDSSRMITATEVVRVTHAVRAAAPTIA